MVEPVSAKQRSSRVYIKTYGCQMNVYDSERMGELLIGEGFQETGSPEDADLVILNTCHIREKAAEKVYSEIGRLRRLKTAGREDMKIAVAGCVAQAEGEEIVKRAPAVDIVFGPQTYHRLPDLLARNRKSGAPVVETEFPLDEKFEVLDRPVRQTSRRVAAFLTVQEGCDKFCSFCVVPYTRGAEFSRPAGRIIAEAKRLLDQGAREITLLGQNVNAWSAEGPSAGTWDLADLLDALAQLQGLERIRYTTSPPPRHERPPHHRSCGHSQTHALPASAYTIGFRSCPEEDEPQTRCSSLFGLGCSHSSGAAGHSNVVRLHSRLSW